MVVGQPEQVRGALAGLHVLEGDVVRGLAARRRGARGRASICVADGPDVDLARADAERLHQLPGVALACGSLVAKPGHRVREHVRRAAARAGPSPARRRSARAWSPARRRRRSRPSRSRSRAAASPGRGPGCCRPPRSARCGSRGRPGTYGKRSIARRSGTRLARATPSSNSIRRMRREPLAVVADRVAVAARAARGRTTIRSRSTSATISCSSIGEALGLGQQVAVLVDQRLAVPGQVGGRLARARRRCRRRRRSSAPTAPRTARAGSRPCRS